MWSACAGGYRRRPAHPGRVERTMRTEESLDRNRPAGRNEGTAEERRENGAGKSGY